MVSCPGGAGRDWEALVMFSRYFRSEPTLVRGASLRFSVESLECRRLLASMLPGADPGDVAPAADELGTLFPDVSAALPEAVVGGARARGASATITITNANTEPYAGPVTVTLFAS